MSNSNTIHVIIINWNGINDTIECIRSIRSQKNILPKIHLWDNNSENDEIKRLQEELGDENINYYPSESNLGFTHASNELISTIINEETNIAPEYIVMINNDTILEPYCLSNLLTFSMTHRGDVISTKMLQYGQRNVVDNLGHKMLRTGEIVPALKTGDLTSNRTNFGACGGGVLISIRCLKDLGAFDPYFNTGYEDAEFGLRAMIYGYKTLHCDSAIIYHKGGNSIKKIFDDKYAIKVQKDILFTMCKLYPAPLLFIILPFSLVRNLIMGCFSMLLGRFNYLKILFKATFEFLAKDIKTALEARKRLNPRKKAINSVELFSMQGSSLIFDLKRAFKYLVLRKKSSLDQYR